MSPLEFDHELRKRLLTLRFNLNRSAQCMNLHNIALENALVAAIKSSLRLEASTERLRNCMRAHGYE